LKIRACNYENRCGGWSNEEYLSVNTFPTTTTIAVPRYKLDEIDGKNYRWDPCKGQIRMKLNHGGRLNSTQLNKWEEELLSIASGIATATGLDFVYAGITTQELASEHPGSGRHSADVLIYIGPLGTGLLEGLTGSGSFVGMIWYDGWTSGVWGEANMHETQIATSYATASYMFPYGKTYLMHWIGRAFGLDALGEGIDAELMSWGSAGSGSDEYPQWGTGDLIGFGLVGASNGCVN